MATAPPSDPTTSTGARGTADTALDTAGAAR
jgi:hypothetical protein